jgi:hypothetical protein
VAITPEQSGACDCTLVLPDTLVCSVWLVGTTLDISEITVKAYYGRVMRKMQASSLADLVRIAARLGLCALERTKLICAQRAIPSCNRMACESLIRCQ